MLAHNVIVKYLPFAAYNVESLRESFVVESVYN